jgi:hypothetical protein
MPLPEFTETGDLPVAVHPAMLAEIDRMQLEVRECLRLHPSEMTAACSG